MTGYPSIDKPWLKYYKPEDIAQPLPACSIYQYVLENNRSHEEDIALEYFGATVTYGMLFQNIETAAASFAALGVKEGDIVSFLAVTTPEMIYAFYGLNRLGATCNMIDPRMSPETISSILEKTNSVQVVVLDIFSELAANCDIHDRCGIVVLPSGQATVPASLRHMTWDDLISHAQAYRPAPLAPFVPNRPALIEYTGGTTGEPKGVVLSNENVNAASFQFQRSDTGSERGQSWLTPAAPFVAYILIFSMHIPLSLGMVCHVSIYDPRQNARDAIQKRVNHIAAIPLVWETLIRLPEAKEHDFSHIIAPLTGADYMEPKLEKEINDFLENRGSHWKMCQGYGLSETAGGICFNQRGNANRMGSVGFPYIDMVISAFDVDSQKEVHYGETGEICISGPSVMLGYFGNQEATNEMIRRHDDGMLWLHSGDLGHIDSDGFVYIEGRIKRMFVCYNGAKVFTSYIERTIMRSPTVSGCVVVGKQDPDHAIGKVPVAFVILQQEHAGQEEKVKEDLIALCAGELPAYEWPAEWNFLKEFPRTLVGKIDYRALERRLI